MPPVKSKAREYIESLCKKFPSTPSLTLAKKAYKEEPKLFKSLEYVRTMIRKVRGKHGDLSRRLTKDKSLYKVEDGSRDPFTLPESHSEKANVWRLPKAYSKVLVLSDIHFPYHDVEAIESAVAYGKQQDVDAVYINGDMLDFYQLSFHEKDPRKTSIPKELEMGRVFFQWLRDQFKGKPIYYIAGNHEIRIERYLRVKAAELLDMPEFKLDILLKCAEFGIVHIPYRSKCYMGKLLVEHGDKIMGAGGVNPARTALLKFKRPVMVGHFHRTTQENSSVYDGDQQMAWSTGCLCELEPGYMPLNNHNHGAAIVTVDHESGHFRVENFQIINGKVY
jgi:predicted phosphodiesterase